MCFLHFNKVVYNGVIWKTLIRTQQTQFSPPILWGHLAHFEPNSTNTFSLPILRGHLAHFEPGSIFHNYYNFNCELVP